LFTLLVGEEDSQPSFRSAEESEDSDLSDGDEYLFPEGKGDENKKFIRLSPMPTTRRRIKALFANTEKVLFHFMLHINLFYGRYPDFQDIK